MTAKSTYQILVIEYEFKDLENLTKAIEKKFENVVLEVVKSIEETKLCLKSKNYDLIITENILPDGEFYEDVLPYVTPSKINIIVTTRTISEEKVIAFYKKGIAHLILKDINEKYVNEVCYAIESYIEKGEKETNSANILFVEDEEIDQTFIRRNFIQRNPEYDCDLVDSVEGAKDLMNSKTYHLVITDHQLVDGNGFDILELTNELNIPTIAMTSKGSEKIVASFFKKGAVDYIIKDQMRGDHLLFLSAIVDSILRQHRLVTNLKKTKNELEARQTELERKNKELEQFSYITSHNLKEPVSNLSGLINLLEESKCIDSSCNEIFENVKEAIGSMHNMLVTLNKVITVQKNLRLPTEKVRFSEITKDTLKKLEKIIHEKNAVINTNFEECEEVNYPPIHLQHILQNLISNALKYHKEGKSPEVGIRTLKESGYICLIVEDKGRGMDMREYGDKLFGLFERFHLDTEGDGIGLYITKSIVENYRGRIEVESQLNEGTTFKVFLVEL